MWAAKLQAVLRCFMNSELKSQFVQALVTFKGCQQAIHKRQQRIYFLLLLLFFYYTFLSLLPLCFVSRCISFSFSLIWVIFIILMSLVGLWRKTNVATLTPLPTGPLNNCILKCPMLLASVSHEENTMKLKCVYVLRLIMYIHHDSLMTQMHFRLPISFLHRTKKNQTTLHSRQSEIQRP